MSDCIFCEIAEKRIEAAIVFEDERCLAFEDLNPQAPTHILIIPRTHFPTLDDVPGAESGLLGHMVSVATRLGKQEALSRSGYRLVWNCGEGAGQSVFHIHLHLLGGRAFAWPPG